jgi:hypothetical protein
MYEAFPVYGNERQTIKTKKKEITTMNTKLMKTLMSSLVATAMAFAAAFQVGATIDASQTQARGGADLPFHGRFTSQTSAVANCPPTCPPTTLLITGTQDGNATHLGRFTATTEDSVNIATTQSTGTFNLTAANGDRIFTTTVGQETGFQPPNVSFVTQTATIVGGTGRFAGATGTFTVEFAQTIDFAAGTATGTGSFKGLISFDK